MKTKLTFSYWQPTPIFWRKVGDLCLIVSLAAAGASQFMELGWYAAAVSILGIIGKILTNFFAK